MRRLLLTVAAVVVLFASEAAAQGCTTPDPGAGFLCHNGQWLPPGHPDRPKPTVTDDPKPDQQPKRTFWIGHRYVRGTTDISIAGMGQLGGVSVLFAVCNEEGDGCFFKGYIRAIIANAESSDFTHLGPY